MAKLLVIENSNIVKGVFKSLLDVEEDFDYDLASSFKEAKEFLSKSRYEFAISERVLEDAPHGEIIALLNKHNVAPLLFTKTIDEDFFEAFEGAKIVDYIIKDKYNNISNVIERLKQLLQNKKRTVLVVSDSHIFNSYLRQSLNLHSFKVLSAANNEEAYAKIDKHPNIALMIIDNKEPYLDALSLVKEVRKYRSHNELKILAIAQESNSYLTSQLLNAGANDFIVKEFSRSELYVRVYQNVNKFS